ncbi:MAG: hypothetical protein CVT67_06750 [Actinobacteria bacterium HGW-Actinobacteria-7]|nr:MAG: hypothetical protein CVT67_06750 [Actinobacteria bacterium HGW-Actinobacteria-7]
MSQSKPVRTVFTIIMDILVAMAIAVTIRLVIEFFGQLASQSWGEAIIALTKPVTIPLGIEAIKTPYGGFFDVNAGVSVVLFLVAEWVLSVVRSRA